MLKAILDEVPDDLKDYYTTDADGRNVLAVESVDGFALENINGLKSALQKELQRRKDAEKGLSAFGDLDVDEARAAIAKLAELQDQPDPEKIAQTKIDAMTRKLAAQHQAEIDKAQQRIAEQGAMLDQLLRKNEITKAIASYDGNPTWLEPLLDRRVRLADDKRIEVIDDDGSPMINNKGEPLTVADFVGQLAEDPRYGDAFPSRGHSGTGKGQGAGRGEPVTGAFGGDREQRMAAIKARFNY